MADSKISDLTAATSALLADEFAVNEAGTSKKLTLRQIAYASGAYASGSVTVPTGNYMMMARSLILTGTQQVVLQGTAVLRIN